MEFVCVAKVRVFVGYIRGCVFGGGVNDGVPWSIDCSKHVRICIYGYYIVFDVKVGAKDEVSE